MADRRDHTTIDMPKVLRDRLARHRRHGRQSMHEVVEEALDYWEDRDGILTPRPMPVPVAVETA